MIRIIKESEYQKLIKRLNELEEFYEHAQKICTEAQASCDVAFDFAHPDIRVYSIERVHARNGEPEHTLICWYDKADKHHNWYCYCNHDRHNQLVAEYRKHKKKLKEAKK